MQNESKNQEATGKPNSQPKKIDKRYELVFCQVAKSYFQVISYHRSILLLVNCFDFIV